MSENLLETFVEETTELLQLMEDSLLELECAPDDNDTLNSLFRSVHTIKGSSGVFGFDEVESFAHVVENLLDRARSEDGLLTKQNVEVLLKCRDHIELLVNAALKDEPLTDEAAELGDTLIRKLSEIMGDPAPELKAHNKESESESPGEESSESCQDLVITDNWHISLRLDAEVLQHGMDPLSFIRYLEGLGRVVHVTVLHDDIPDFENINPELCYLGFEIDLESEAEKNDIERVFDFIQELSTLHILPPKAKISEYAGLITDLPESAMRVGEILLATGALTKKELQTALEFQEKYQQEYPAETSKPRLGEVLVEQKVVHEEVVKAALDKQSQVEQRPKNRVLRVDADKLDKLINLVGELVISGAASNLLARRTGDEELMESISQMSRLVEEIRDNALTLRMVQIGETFNRFKRVVYEISKELNKEVSLEISGGDTELDKTVVEKIGDPLMHLVRNALDHGIEPVEERIEWGKPREGLLRLNAYHDSGSIVIEVNDDGRGLHAEKILKKAMDRGLVHDAQNLSNQEIYRLIFEPGFSTTEQVTNLSGRGVGMDVVKRNIEALRGNVEVDSSPGAGTTIKIRLPLTLAIIDGFLVGVGQSNYVIPLDMIMECIELGDKQNKHDTSQSYINLRGEVLPYIRLRDMFSEEVGRAKQENIVVVEYAGHKAGLVVDQLLGELQTVIKPMGKIFQHVRGVSGATILGSGDVAVILDIPNLVQRAAVKHDHKKEVTIH